MKIHQLICYFLSVNYRLNGLCSFSRQHSDKRKKKTCLFLLVNQRNEQKEKQNFANKISTTSLINKNFTCDWYLILPNVLSRITNDISLQPCLLAFCFHQGKLNHQPLPTISTFRTCSKKEAKLCYSMKTSKHCRNHIQNHFKDL